MIENNPRPIGVFDSGIGGLTAVRELVKLLPGEDILYFGDTARVPYGSHSRETIISYAREDLQFLLNHRVKAVLVACGTVSSTSLPVLRTMTDIPIVGVIEPASVKAAKMTENRRIAVLATEATINSRAYSTVIRDISARTGTEYEVMEKACQLFVPLVENGFTDRDHPIVRAVVAEYLRDVAEFDADTVILGCTHYPLLKNAILDYMPALRIVESGKEAARALADLLPHEKSAAGTGCRQYYLSEKTETFVNTCEWFVGEKISDSLRVVSLSGEKERKD